MNRSLPSPADFFYFEGHSVLFATAREKVFTVRTIWKWRNYFSDQKCVVLYVSDMISWFPPALSPHPSSIISPSKWPMRVWEIVVDVCTLLGLQFGQTKTRTVPSDLNMFGLWPQHGIIPCYGLPWYRIWFHVMGHSRKWPCKKNIFKNFTVKAIVMVQRTESGFVLFFWWATMHKFKPDLN
jgi:hypothetical protein